MGTGVPPAPAGVGTGFRRAYRDAHSGRIAGGTGADDPRASGERLPASQAVSGRGGSGGGGDASTGGSGRESLLFAVKRRAAARRAARVVVPAVRAIVAQALVPETLRHVGEPKGQ